jgi:asparagine synthase (glutamine-hydrolysing)
MCRISGLWNTNKNISFHNLSEIQDRMRDTLRHGGPDSADSYKNDHSQIYLGHRRLSIIDLSDAGKQPMRLNHNILVFNGEIYNYKEIAEELGTLGHRFQSHSDTEVLLHAFEEWGKKAVDKFRGMFAFALWNEKTEKLLLCRDRIGVKPLYWYYKEGLFMFASELKAFHEHPHFDKTLNKSAVSLYLQQGYIPAPLSIYQFAHKLSAGSFLEINKEGLINTESYWNIESYYQNSTLLKADETELSEELERILRESFKLRMVADVPVGMFLSGGVDSSTVVALLQQETNAKLKTFTIGFQHPEYNEAVHAKAISEYLGTEHFEFICTEKDFENCIDEMPEIYDEPMGDTSNIPTYLVAQLAKKEVKVSLSADGGDELFGGYVKYEAAQNFYPKIKKIPSFIRNLVSGISNGIDPLWLERNAPRLPIVNRYKNISNKFPKFRNALKAKDLLDFFNRSSTYISRQELEKLHAYYQNRFETNIQPQKDRVISWMGMIDMLTWLEGDIMTKVDRSTMRVALEGREPMLDHKIVEFSMLLPDSLKINGNVTKYLLRKVLYKNLPKELIERPKQGFAIPIQDWLLGILRGELEKMSTDQSFIQSFDFGAKELQKTVFNFLNQKKYVNPHYLWFVYMLYKWHLRWNS